MILLNPGPVTLTERVRRALTRPDLCHREPEFADLQDDIRARLLGVYDLNPREWAAVVLSGSGTAAVEAMIASLPGKEAKLLIIENGVYGERMARMAAIHGIAHETLALGWGEAIERDVLGGRLNSGGFSHIAVVHHETTTGRLNDLTRVGECARAHGAELLVDGVSSFGAEPIAFDALPVSACAATANKCLHGAPGACFVIARRAAIARAATRSLYLDIAGLCDRQDGRSTAFTPAIPAFYALAAALAEHAEAGGWRARRQRYRELSAQLAKDCADFGIKPLLEAEASSCVLRAYRLPRGVPYPALHERLKAAGFVIYAGQGALARAIFRVSPMGAVTAADMRRLADTLGQAVAALRRCASRNQRYHRNSH